MNTKKTTIADVHLLTMIACHLGECEGISWFHAADHNEKWFREKIIREDCFGCVAMAPSLHGGGYDVLGYVLYRKAERNERDVMEIVDIAVHPSTRRRGVGWKLLDHVRQFWHHRPFMAWLHVDQFGEMEFFAQMRFNIVCKDVEADRYLFWVE